MKNSKIISLLFSLATISIVKAQFNCSRAIINQGYKCCSINCKIVYTDNDGDWGIENGQWCGCGVQKEQKEQCSKKILNQGYKCCSENCKVIYTDDDGDWGAENGQWCGCGVQKEQCSKKILNQGYKCCSDNCEVIYMDNDGDWGIENGQWCGCSKPITTTTTTTTTTKSTPTTTTKSTPTPTFCSNSISKHRGESKTITEIQSDISETLFDGKTYYLNAYDYYFYPSTKSQHATFYSDGSFKCEIDDVYKYECRQGISIDSNKTNDQIKSIKADFQFSLTTLNEDDGYYYSGVYGYCIKDELKKERNEFFIVDDWKFDYQPDCLGENYGVFTIDGAKYSIYENIQNVYDNDGSYKINSIFSVRQETRSCGTIDVMAHIKAWEKIGIKLYKIQTVMISGSAGNNRHSVYSIMDFPYGNIDVKYNSDHEHTGESITITKNQNTFSKTLFDNKTYYINTYNYNFRPFEGNKNATFYSDGSFTCNANNAYRYECKYGVPIDNNKTNEQIKSIKADFELDHQIENNNNGYFYSGVYGNCINEKFNGEKNEFYIIDDWSIDYLPDCLGYGYGDFTIDGATYSVFENYMFDGNVDVHSIFSVRQQPRHSGTIDVMAHIKAWEDLALKVYNIQNVMISGTFGNDHFSVSGSMDFTYAKIDVEYNDDDDDHSKPNVKSITIVENQNDLSQELFDGRTYYINAYDYYFQPFEADQEATFYSDGSFTCNANDVYRYECKYGVSIDNNKTNEQIKSIKANFEIANQKLSDDDAYFYAGIYGYYINENNAREKNEFYIIDDWKVESLPDCLGQKYGETIIDGAKYGIFRNRQFISDRNDNYVLISIFSVREEPHHNGTIDITAHIKAWEEFGMKVNNIQTVMISGTFGSDDNFVSGSMNFKNAKIDVEYNDDDDDNSKPNVESITIVENQDDLSQELFDGRTYYINAYDYYFQPSEADQEATFYSDGSFTCNANNVYRYECKYGVPIDSNKTNEQIKSIKANFEIVNQKLTDDDAYFYAGIYGYYINENNTREKNEFYIIDDWKVESLPDCLGQKYGEIIIDGAKYGVFRNRQFISDRNDNYVLISIFSVREEPHHNGTIDITAHIKAWEEFDMKVNNIQTVMISGTFGNDDNYVSGSMNFKNVKFDIEYISDDNDNDNDK